MASAGGCAQEKAAFGGGNDRIELDTLRGRGQRRRSKRRPISDRLLDGLSDRLSTDFPINADYNALLSVQFGVDPTGRRQLLGVRRLGALSRFIGKEGRRRLRMELQRLVKKPPIRLAE